MPGTKSFHFKKLPRFDTTVLHEARCGSGFSVDDFCKNFKYGKTMTNAEKFSVQQIRQIFTNYFVQNKHTAVQSSSLIPAEDPTLLFTNAGMVPFKDVFLGKEVRSYKRATSVQKCMRASGKHNDLENVGYTPRHHTFFEMLGNFSFGDYFKKEAINFAWEFLTAVLAINPQKLWVTVHEKDDEAAKLWEQEFAASGKRPQGLSRCGDKDNFWAMGETGPCGFCSEIFYDHGENFSGNPPPEDGADRYVEIWNLVFMQFERDKHGKLVQLPKPSVDTGMGLERIAAVMQGVHTNYDIDLFQKLIGKNSEIVKQWHISSEEYQQHQVSLRVIGDHIRAIAFLIADGVVPSNEGRGYVVRRIIRRAVRHMRNLESGVKASLCDLVKYLVVVMGEAYPELTQAQFEIERVLRHEETLFLETLDKGLKHFAEAIAKLSGKEVPGEVIFYLYDTYGFPVELTMDMAKERGFTLDEAGFNKAMEEQRNKSRAASKFALRDELKIDLVCGTKFIGYDKLAESVKIQAIYNNDGMRVSNLAAKTTGIIILEQTPFYAESGGQVGDTGELRKDGKTVFIVKDTKKQGNFYLHFGEAITGELIQDDFVQAEVDQQRRQAIQRNHSATHLLHKALRLVLGERAEQRGSYVDENRLRFDFAHTEAIGLKDLNELERIVNAKIRECLVVTTTIKSLDEAKRDGVVALFGEKYGTEVRVVAMGEFSKELCGGTHVNNTGEIGFFKIVGETAVAAGIRRIEATTGEAALELVSQYENTLHTTAKLLNASYEQITNKLQVLLEEKRGLEKELQKLKNYAATNQSSDLISQVVTINNAKVLVAKVANLEVGALRLAVDALKQKLVNYTVLLASVCDAKIHLVSAVSKELTAKISASDLVKQVALQIGGSGGGRPEMAQGGGVDVANLEVALDNVKKIIASKL